MKKLDDVITTTYFLTTKNGKDFFVDIQENQKTIEAYLYCNEYAIKELLFGGLVNDRVLFLSCIEENALQHIDQYIIDYMQ